MPKTNANFNDLTFPKGAYDAVFLIGVLEYAKRFLPTAKDHKDAVIKIMSLAESTLKREGLLFIAIENRMGLKYWMGASEDHCGEPYVGLYGYPQDQGIRTFDKTEWEDILKNAGIQHYRFCYPFPDYKVPRVMLSDNYVRNDVYAHSILYRICSRDYVKDWQPDIDEFLLWESLHQSGYLEHFANSFFIVISKFKKQLNNVIPYDFVYFSDSVRKPVYRTVTIKPRDRSYVVKQKMTDIEVTKDDEFIRQNLSRSKYIKGPLLSSIWLHSLVGCDDTTRFEKLIHEYYCFLLEYFNKREESNDTLDLLPFNIMLDDTGLYRVIDKEWIITARISPEYVLFRALLWFSHNDKELLSRICEIKNIVNVKGFIEYGFSSLSLPLDQELDKLIELANGIAVKEHKSTNKSIDPDSTYWGHLNLDVQTTMYIYAARQEQMNGWMCLPGRRDPLISTVKYDVYHKPQISPKKLTQAESKKFVETGEYMGQQFNVTELGNDQPGQQYISINGGWEEIEPGAKEGTFAIRETPDMFGARLLKDITERPEFYFRCVELSKTDAELKAFEQELYDIAKNMQYMIRSGRYYSNEHACEATFRCDYIEQCYNHIQVDSDHIPDGFKCIFVKEFGLEKR